MSCGKNNHGRTNNAALQEQIKEANDTRVPRRRSRKQANTKRAKLIDIKHHKCERKREKTNNKLDKFGFSDVLAHRRKEFLQTAHLQAHTEAYPH
jgi:hypothetical protein